jgi:hypothetical protein
VRWLPAWELVSQSNDSVLGYLPAGKDVSRGHLKICYHETTSEDIEYFMCAAVTVIFRVW